MKNLVLLIMLLTIECYAMNNETDPLIGDDDRALRGGNAQLTLEQRAAVYNYCIRNGYSGENDELESITAQPVHGRAQVINSNEQYNLCPNQVSFICDNIDACSINTGINQRLLEPYLVNALGKILEQSERINKLIGEDDLKSESYGFESAAKKLRRKIWLNRYCCCFSCFF
ncbi:MAG: hypothetical protein CMM87_01900 [Rickettsiales bacterium]|nr:hypothetical protein [Rickettsiales bacterium]|tara:strand:- start:20849 stop:21364 length:516 start_codon:yes stop_codon:yes gene_type:complete